MYLRNKDRFSIRVGFIFVRDKCIISSYKLFFLSKQKRSYVIIYAYDEYVFDSRKYEKGYRDTLKADWKGIKRTIRKHHKKDATMRRKAATLLKPIINTCCYNSSSLVLWRENNLNLFRFSFASVLRGKKNNVWCCV